MLHQLAGHATAALYTADVPNPKPQAPPEVAEKVEALIGFLRYGVIAACVAGMFLVAGKAALAHRRGELSDVMGSLGAVLAACLLVASGSALVGFMT